MLQILANGLIIGAIYGLVALGFALIYRTVRFFHFAHGAVFAVGAYVAYVSVAQAGLSYVLVAPIVIISCGAIGLLIDRLVYRPLRRRRASNLVFLLASFGVFLVIQNLLQLVFGAQVQSLRAGTVVEGNRVLGVVITDLQLIICCVGVVSLLLLLAAGRITRVGTAIRCVSDDVVGAELVGISSEKIIGISFIVGSSLSGIAGMLLAAETNLHPAMGMNAVLKAIIASIIGGVGSIYGAFLGGILLGLAENVGAWYGQAAWKDAISFGILILFLLIRPHGIFGGSKPFK